MKKLLLATVLLALCAAIWFLGGGEKSPAEAETQKAAKADSAAAAAFVTEFRTALAAPDTGKLRTMCDNPKSEELRGQFELLRQVKLAEHPDRVEFRTARNDSWSLFYPTGNGEMQIVLRRLDDGSFRFKHVYSLNGPDGGEE